MRLNQLTNHHPFWLSIECRLRDSKSALPHTEVIRFFPLTDLIGKTSQQCSMDTASIELTCAFVGRLWETQHNLPMNFTPFPYPVVLQSFVFTPLPKLVVAQRIALTLNRLPKLNPADELAQGVSNAFKKSRMLKWRLHRQSGCDQTHIPEHMTCLCLNQHTPNPWINRHPSNASAVGCQLHLRAHQACFPQLAEPISNELAFWGIHKWELFRVPQLEVEALQHHRCQVGPHDFWIGERRSRFKVLTIIEPDRNPRLDATTAAAALIGTGLTDGLDGQALQTAARRISTDARDPRIDDIANPGYCQGRLSDVGRQHNPLQPRLIRTENTALLLTSKPRIQGQHVETINGCMSQVLRHIPDLALAR